MSVKSLPVLLALIALPLAAEAAPTRTAFIVAGAAERAPSTRSLDVRAGQAITLYAVVREGSGRRARYYTDAPGVRLGRARVNRRRVHPLSQLPGADSGVRIDWWRVEPRMQHVETPAPNGDNPAYSNCVLFGPRHGKWLGYDQIEYHETPIEGAGSTLVVRRADPSDRRLAPNRGLGTMRYKVTVTVGGTTVASPGAEARGVGGIRPHVMRVSFRRGDDLPGYLTAYFNVPNLFGSAGRGSTHQTELFQGADCADVISGAARLAGAAVPYTHVAALPRYAPPVSEVLHMDGDTVRDEAGEPVRLVFGRDVRPGDIMIIDYSSFDGTRRRWDHVAVVSQDRGTPGVFDPADLVLHMGFLTGLREEAARTQAPAAIRFLRLKRRYARRFRAQ